MLHFGKAQPALLCQESDLGAGAPTMRLPADRRRRRTDSWGSPGLTWLIAAHSAQPNDTLNLQYTLNQKPSPKP